MKDKGSKIRVPRKSRVFLAAILLLMAAITAGGTLAWIIDSSTAVTNNFVVPDVTTTIEEDFEDGDTVKSNVSIKNDVTADKGIDAYIRVALVPTWETTEGAVAPIPASLADLDMSWNPTSNGWITHGGFYYYTGKVAPGASTSILIQTATVRGSSEGAQAGYRMNLQILAEAVQATETAVTDAWGGAVWASLTH